MPLGRKTPPLPTSRSLFLTTSKDTGSVRRVVFEGVVAQNVLREKHMLNVLETRTTILPMLAPNFCLRAARPIRNLRNGRRSCESGSIPAGAGGKSGFARFARRIEAARFG